MSGRFRQKLRNNAAAIVTTVAMLAAGTAVVLSNKCGSKVCKRTPMTESVRKSVRNDKFCDQNESHPYKMNKDGSIMRDKKGKPIRNPLYSKADCFTTDNVWDKATHVKDLKDPEGNPVDLGTLQVVKGGKAIKYNDGTVLDLPLEGPDSYDAKMEAVRQYPCADLKLDPTAQRISLAQRPLLSVIDPNVPFVQRTRKNILAILAKPSRIGLGNNYFVMANGYKETCTSTLSVCKPDTPIECYCPNHQSCLPAKCGNGEIDRGEDCDPNHSRKRKGYVCSWRCKWVKKKTPVCGNNKREGTEQCDGRDASRCESRQCKSNCRCKPKDPEPPMPPPPRCGDGKVNQASEQCDPPNSKCGTGNKGTCDSSCKCKPPRPPPPTKVPRCQVDGTVGSVMSSVKSYIKGRRLRFSREYQHSGTAKVMIRVKVFMDLNGKAKRYTMTSDCSGSSTNCPVRKLTAYKNRKAFGRFNISRLRKINSQGQACYIYVEGSAPTSGN